MVDIHAFRGWRYDLSQVGDLSDVTAPPYDVIGPAQQDDLYKKHPCNVIRLELNRDEPGDTNPDDRYARAAGFLRRWMHERVLQQEHEEALYVYHQEYEWEGQKYVRKGFMGRCRLERFGEGQVFPHEQTMSGPKADRLALLKACRMNLSPIFGLYPDANAAVQAPLDQAIIGVTPLAAVDHLGVVHKLWPISNHATISKVRELMRDKPIFIADGHHRYETANNYRDAIIAEKGPLAENAGENFVMMMCVGMSDPGLTILPTHRLVSGLPELTSDQVKAALEKNFEVELIGSGSAAARETWELIEADGGQGILGFGTLDGKWLLARAKDISPMQQLAPEQSDAWRALGVSLLHKLALEHLIGAKHPQAKQQCTYVHLLDEVIDGLQKRECQLGCLVPPAQIDDVEEIASHFEKMPAKSTYFYPKLQSGMVFNSVDA
jgi:uncharacterized protein (DUF1015 family)